uniref:Transmembrane protease serine 9 n=1 Tax=Austrofundulus limnaeus TaxID=52670 RepID=A0A2I4DBN4_AUSLI
MHFLKLNLYHSAAVVCGQAPLNSRISGGSSVVTAGEWPWMVSLQKNRQHVCGGTLVSEDSVLTSANCFTGSTNVSDWTIILGRLKQNGSNPFEVSLNVTNITMSNLTGTNIAVLNLSARPTLNNYIQPVCLDNTRTFPVGSTCWAAGWSSGQGGVEEVLLEFQTSVVDCGNISISDRICTEFFKLEQGDSGGPLMCIQDGSWFQTAVLPFSGTSTRTKRQTAVLVFPSLKNYQPFLQMSLGTFLSPRTISSTNDTNTISSTNDTNTISSTNDTNTISSTND